MNEEQDQNYYELLGVEADAEEIVIKKAYKKKVLLCHPDKNPENPNAAEEFREITEAYNTLTDKEARLAYDERLNAPMIDLEMGLIPEDEDEEEEEEEDPEKKKSFDDRPVEKLWTKMQINHTLHQYEEETANVNGSTPRISRCRIWTIGLILLAQAFAFCFLPLL